MCFPVIRAVQPPSDPSDLERFPSFRMLLNFGAGAADSDSIRYGRSKICEVHDFNEETCLKLACPQGQMRNTNRFQHQSVDQVECIPINGLDHVSVILKKNNVKNPIIIKILTLDLR